MNEEIMNVNENEEDVINLVPAEDSEEECESSGSILGTVVKIGVGVAAGVLASKIISRAKPKFQELKEKHAARKSAKKAETYPDYDECVEDSEG